MPDKANLRQVEHDAGSFGHNPGNRVVRGFHVCGHLRPAAAGSEAPVLDVPDRNTSSREFDGKRGTEVQPVLPAPESAVDLHDHRDWAVNGIGNVQMTELLTVGTVGNLDPRHQENLAQARALPAAHSAQDTVQSPFCHTSSGAPPVFLISTTSPGCAKSKNHLALAALRLRQPCDVSVLP